MLGEMPVAVETMRGEDYNNTGASGDCKAYARLHLVPQIVKTAIHRCLGGPDITVTLEPEPFRPASFLAEMVERWKCRVRQRIRAAQERRQGDIIRVWDPIEPVQNRIECSNGNHGDKEVENDTESLKYPQ